MSRTVTVTDATLESLASNEQAVAALPNLLGNLASTRSAPITSNCPKCRASAASDARRAALGRARQAIAALSQPDQAALKRLLNADSITVYISTATGQVLPFTI